MPQKSSRCRRIQLQCMDASNRCYLTQTIPLKRMPCIHVPIPSSRFAKTFLEMYRKVERMQSSSFTQHTTFMLQRVLFQHVTGKMQSDHNRFQRLFSTCRYVSLFDWYEKKKKPQPCQSRTKRLTGSPQRALQRRPCWSGLAAISRSPRGTALWLSRLLQILLCLDCAVPHQTWPYDHLQ